MSFQNVFIRILLEIIFFIPYLVILREILCTRAYSAFKDLVEWRRSHPEVSLNTDFFKQRFDLAMNRTSLAWPLRTKRLVRQRDVLLKIELEYDEAAKEG